MVCCTNIGFMRLFLLLSYRYRIEPNRTQAAALTEMLADFCAIYNAGLEQPIAAYRRRGRRLRQQKVLGAHRTMSNERPESGI